MRELEAKLLVDEGFVVPLDAGEAAGLSPGAHEVREVHDVYHDTDDLRLARWGCTVRRRWGSGWTVKIPLSDTATTLDRHEVDFPDAETVPGEAVRLVTSFTRGAPLAEVARLTTRRTVHPWLHPDGSVAVELTDDEVRGSTPGGRCVALREIEVELGRGASPHLLDAVVARLRAAGAGQDEPAQPKLVRVLGKRAAAPPDVRIPRLGERPSARKVIRVALASSVTRLLVNIPVARLGLDPEGVHQARVATRRLRSDLRTFGPLLDPHWTRTVRAELEWLAAELGVVRDTDVLMGHLRTLAAEHPEIDPVAATRIVARLRSERDAARERLLAHLVDDRALTLFDHLVAAAADPPVTAEARGRGADVLPALVRRPWRRLRREVHRLGDAPAPTELHRVRLLAKRLRYASEAVAPAVGRPAERFATHARTIQDLLGEVNDAVVAHHWLARSAADVDSAFAFAAGQLSQQLCADSMHQRTDWLAAFARLERPKATRWLE